MKEYKVNDYITLKLENNKTTIYVKGKRFMQCKYLLLINPHELEKQWEIDSIDEAADELSSKLEKELKPIDLGITPEEEFWGHCSNIQAWFENNYDTRLLHRNLAFFLLLKLAEKGNERAKIVFKEEIAKRLGSGNKNVISFLIEESIISYLSDDEIIQSILVPEEAEIILNLQSELSIELFWTFWKTSDSCAFYVEDKHVKEINLHNLKLEKFPKLLEQLEFLEKINLSNNNISIILFSIFKKLKNLKELNLRNNPISIVDKKKSSKSKKDKEKEHKKPKLPRITVSLDIFIEKIIKKMADCKRTTISEIIREILSKWIEANTKIIKSNYNVNYEDLRREIELENEERE